MYLYSAPKLQLQLQSQLSQWKRFKQIGNSIVMRRQIASRPSLRSPTVPSPHTRLSCPGSARSHCCRLHMRSLLVFWPVVNLLSALPRLFIFQLPQQTFPRYLLGVFKFNWHCQCSQQSCCRFLLRMRAAQFAAWKRLNCVDLLTVGGRVWLGPGPSCLVVSHSYLLCKLWWSIVKDRARVAEAEVYLKHYTIIY